MSHQNLPSLKSITDLKGKRVLLRGSFNAPLKDGRVLDDFRLRKTLPTIEYLEEKGAKVILIGHIGRDPKESLRPVVEHFNKELGKTVGFAPDIYASDLPERIESLGDGQVLMLENLRQFPGEKAGDMEYAKHLASFGDLYVNDCFADSHRSHASITGIPKLLPSYAGLLLEGEVEHLSKALDPKHPFLFIIGGAKFETKVPLLEKFADLADTVFVGGAIAHDLLRAEGIEIGESLVGDAVPYAKELAEKENITLPVDTVVLDDRGKSVARDIHDVRKTDKIYDAGKNTIKDLKGKVKEATFIVWNGPLGFYEEGYDKASKKLLKAIAKSSAFSIIGGGDTTALVSKLKMEESFSFVSTGGGAMLDFLEKGDLPGIAVLRKK